MKFIKPNILFICVDQQRFDCLGYNEKYPVKTPNIDRLANEGMRFEKAYTSIPTCCPSRQGLICGKRPESFGALCNYDQGISVKTLPKDAFSWARELKSAGYNNAYTGEWHVSPDYSPLDFGYDKYISNAEIGLAAASYMTANNLQFKPFFEGIFGEMNPVPLEDAATHRHASFVNSLINEYNKKDEPWHIRMNFAEPHLPCRPSEPFASMYSAEDIPIWAAFDDKFENKPYIQKQHILNWGLENSNWDTFKGMAALYYGYISQVDDAVGRVISNLENLGILDETVIIYTTDHGDMAGERHMLDKHYVMYESVIHTPLLVRYPKMVKAGSVCNEYVVNMLDLVPTFLEFAQCEVPNGLHAVSLMPYLLGEKHENARKYALVTYNGQQFGLFFQRMIRNDNFKYVWNLTDTDELYDMVKDPYELKNEIGNPEFADILSELRHDLYFELLAVEDTLVSRSPWLKKQLLEGKKL